MQNNPLSINVSSELPTNIDDNTLVIGTHSGIFHSDEVVAIALLILLNPGKRIEIVRTRDQKILDQCQIVVDIGNGEFDHHQKGFDKKRENGIKLASAGLVYHKFSSDIINIYLESFNPLGLIEKFLKDSGRDANISLTSHELEELKQTIINDIDKNLIVPVDAKDNGMKIYYSLNDIFEFIPSFNSVWCEKDFNHYNSNFKDALLSTIVILDEKIKGTMYEAYRSYFLKKLENENIKIPELNATSKQSVVQTFANLLNTDLNVTYDNVNSFWNNYSDEVITYYTNKINPVDNISAFYSNMWNKYKDNKYLEIIPIIKEKILKNEKEVQASIKDAIYQEIIIPIEESSQKDEKSFTANILEAKIREIIAREYARPVITTLLENPKFFTKHPEGFTILELPWQTIPWENIIFEWNKKHEKEPSKCVDFVYYLYTDEKTLAVHCVSPSPEEEFDERISLYPFFGEPGIWVHPNNFFARGATTKEQIIDLCIYGNNLKKWNTFYGTVGDNLSSKQKKEKDQERD